MLWLFSIFGCQNGTVSAMGTQSFLVQLHGLTEVPKWLCRDPQTLEIKTERILSGF
jgi:hypothetical protein